MKESIPVGAQEGVSDHFAAGMQFQVTLAGEIKFLVISYRQEGQRFSTLKFPGGTNKLSKEPPRFRDESPVDTLRREWGDEVGTELQEAYNNPHHVEVKDPQTGHIHYKFFFLIGESMTTGKLRTVEKKECEKGSKVEYLGPPKWISATDLLGRNGIRNPAHRDALLTALEAIEGMRRRGQLPSNVQATGIPVSTNLFS